MYHDDLTMSEVLHDPMIRLMLRADHVPLGEFAKIMENAARARNLTSQDRRERPPLEAPQ